MNVNQDSGFVQVGTWNNHHRLNQPPNHILLQNCQQGIIEVQKALGYMDNAGTLLTQSLAQALNNTAYRCVADTLCSGFRDVFSSGMSRSSIALFNEMQMMISNILNLSNQNPQDCLQDGQV